MNKVSAMQAIDRILKEDFKYLYIRDRIDINTLHLTFQMDSKSHSLQMALTFREMWCDILCFISPTILTFCGDNYWEALQVVNYINWSVKLWGRYYIDTHGDLAYSLRLDYDVLEKIPYECTKEIECAIDYYADLFVPLLNVCQGKTSFNDTKQFIDYMWGGIH